MVASGRSETSWGRFFRKFSALHYFILIEQTLLNYILDISITQKSILALIIVNILAVSNFLLIHDSAGFHFG